MFNFPSEKFICTLLFHHEQAEKVNLTPECMSRFPRRLRRMQEVLIEVVERCHVHDSTSYFPLKEKGMVRRKTVALVSWGFALQFSYNFTVGCRRLFLAVIRKYTVHVGNIFSSL